MQAHRGGYKDEPKQDDLPKGHNLVAHMKLNRTDAECSKGLQTHRDILTKTETIRLR